MTDSWVERPTADGSWTLWNTRLDEGCHSRTGAWLQATERYAGPCGLAMRARAGVRGPIRLLDIGTGLGLNLAAALAALEPHGVALHAVSLELDPEAIRRGLALYERRELAHGPWAEWHGPVRRALSAALSYPDRPVALGALGRLELRLGDARLALAPGEEGEPFDAVFLDPFSPRRDGDLWGEPFLAEVARRMAPLGWLSTYSAAFRVRLGLARAGLRVGRGPRVGTKGEGTLASPQGVPPPLPARLARRLIRRAGLSAGP